MSSDEERPGLFRDMRMARHGVANVDMLEQREQARAAGTPAASGLLLKEGGLIRRFRERWCEVRGTRLFYWKEHDRRHWEREQGFINLRGAEVSEVSTEEYAHNRKEEPPAGHLFRISASHLSRSFVLAASSVAERGMWLAALREAAGPPTISGRMLKKGGFWTAFRTRWMEMHGKVLEWMKGPDNNNPALGCISLRRAVIITKDALGKAPWRIKITGPHLPRKYVLAATDEAERTRWVEALTVFTVLQGGQPTSQTDPPPTSLQVSAAAQPAVAVGGAGEAPAVEQRSATPDEGAGDAAREKAPAVEQPSVREEALAVEQPSAAPEVEQPSAAAKEGAGDSPMEEAPAVEQPSVREEAPAVEQPSAAAEEGEGDSPMEAPAVEQSSTAAEEGPGDAAREKAPAVEQPSVREEAPAVEQPSTAPEVEQPGAAAEEGVGDAAKEEAPAVEQPSVMEEAPAVEQPSAAAEEGAGDSPMEAPAAEQPSAREEAPAVEQPSAAIEAEQPSAAAEEGVGDAAKEEAPAAEQPSAAPEVEQPSAKEEVPVLGQSGDGGDA